MAQAVTNIARVRSISAPLLQYLWEFLIPRVPGASGEEPRELSFRARISGLPGRQVQVAESRFRGHRIIHPSRQDFDATLDVTFEEGLNGIVTSTLSRWFDVWRDEVAGTGEGEAAFRADIFMRALNHAEDVVLQYHLHEAIVQNMQKAAADYSNQGVVQRAVTFGFSYWTLE